MESCGNSGSNSGCQYSSVDSHTHTNGTGIKQINSIQITSSKKQTSLTWNL